MSRRLADYFVIVGVKDPSTLEYGKDFKGTIIQKFPLTDRKDVPFPQAVELFCQPSGWSLTSKPQPSTFYTAILTDIEGNHSYCACLSFHEPVKIRSTDESLRLNQAHNSSSGSAASDLSDTHWEDHRVWYIPKCLCLVSRQRYFLTLKSCLATIYIAFLNDNISLLGKLTGSILGFVHVPPPGGPKLTFSIGAGDTQVIHPPLSKDLPVTGHSVAILFKFLGIHNMLLIFNALVTENKILIVSSSYTHLVLTCEALIALMYPLTFSYVFIPVLPVSLLDFLTAPTPFLMGVHHSYEAEIPELSDVVTVNVDQGFVIVPDNVNLPIMPEPYQTRTVRLLKMILTPSLLSSDMLFSSDTSILSLARQDKELRSVFIQLFADMFCGYRSCLTLIRIHPKPVISFNKIAFLEKRGLIGDDFFNKLLDSVSFSQMIMLRGPPFRQCNVFDEIIASVDCSQITLDVRDEKLLSPVQNIAQKLYDNEPDSESLDSESQLLPMPQNATPTQQFPLLDESEVEKFISDNAEQDEGVAFRPRSIISQRVPIGLSNYPLTHFINKRRLEVIKDAVGFIFDNKINEARKVLPSVLRALKSKAAQLSLCNELSVKIRQNRAMLETDQFQLVVRLMNAILQDDSSLSNTSVAAALVPLSCAFFRKLTSGVFQFAYSCIQDHPIWASLQFWEEAFYAEAQTQIMEFHILEREMNAKRRTNASNNVVKIDLSKTKSEPDQSLKRVAIENASKGAVRNSVLLMPTPPMAARSRTNTIEGNNLTESDSEDNKKPVDPLTAMDLAAELLSEFTNKCEDERKRLVSEEESIVYSLASLFANRMVYLRVPLAACAEMRRYEEKRQKMQERRAQLQLREGQSDSCLDIQDNVSRKNEPSHAAMESASTIVGGSVREGSNSVAGSVMWSSMHDITDPLESGSTIADQTAKFIIRFVERVCIEANVTSDHIKSLHNLIPPLVNMHIESLDELYRETKYHAPIKKAKITKPAFLQGEQCHFDGLRCYLIPDGRELGVKTESSSAMLPAKDIETDHEIDLGADLGGPCLLPAEGAVFLTNYRVVFKGSPVDQFASEMTVTRSFPLSSLVKEKKVSGRFSIGPDAYIEDCLQLRSATFQLLRLCFDQEVPLEQIENFRKHLQKLRWPPSIHSTFAFATQKTEVILNRTLSQRQQNVRRSNRTFTNVAVIARKKVAQTRGSLRKHKYAVGDDTTKKRYQSVNSYDDGSVPPGELSDGFEVSQEDIKMTFAQTNLGADKLSESFVCRDYERVGLGSINKKQTMAAWRLSMVNGNYGVCRSYPTVVIVPSKVTDETVMKVAKNHRLNRFPVAVWKHKKTRAVLLRSGGVSKGVMSAVLKGGLGGPGSTGILSSTVSEDERFLTEIVNSTAISASMKKSQSVSIGAALSLSNVFEEFSSMNESNTFSKMVDNVVQEKKWAASNLYIFSEKALAKGTKFESTSKCSFVTIEMHDVGHVKASFTRILKACCPSTSRSDIGYLHEVEESKWLQQISSILQVSVAAVNLMEIQGSSCMISFGDGSDVTTQIVSLIQLMMDPYYRTFEGLRVLLEKEWLSFGYRFAHRGNHLSTMQNGLAPFFLQFLDAVHQIILQYPSSFEYSDAFLRFLAHHHTSMRFNNFLLDSEHERHQYGWLAPFDESDPNIRKVRGYCMWKYINEHSSKLTMFHNFKYHSNIVKGVLQPFCNISNLTIWEYYSHENLFTGPIYDLELLSEMDATSAIPTPASSHPPTSDVDGKEDIGLCLTGCYGDTSQFSRDECSYLLNEISRLKEELDQNPQLWKNTWDLLDIRQQLKESRNTFLWNHMWMKERAVSLQKRDTMEIVLQGKTSESTTRNQALGFEQPHNFQYHNYIVHTTCDYCLQSIWGFGRVGLQCENCGYHVHEKCQSMVPAKCPKHSNLEDQQQLGMSTSTHSVPGSEHSMKMSSNAPRGFKSQLYKRGNLLRQWKARWFVLDAQRNQMRYYDHEDDNHLQGFIDLADMRSCSIPAHSPPGAPKWAVDDCFFEIVMTKRVYHLLANDRETAREWVDRLTELTG